MEGVWNELTSLTSPAIPFSPVISSYASSSSSAGVVPLLLLLLSGAAEGSGFRCMGLTGVESSSTAKVFMAFIEVSRVEFGIVVGAAAAASGSVGGLTGGEMGVVILRLVWCVLRRVGRGGRKMCVRWRLNVVFGGWLVVGYRLKVGR